MKKLTLGLTLMLTSAATVFAHGVHGVSADSVGHAPHGVGSLLVVTGVAAGGLVLLKMLLDRAGR
jgi:hypothetical protein